MPLLIDSRARASEPTSTKAVRRAAEAGHRWRDPAWLGPDGGFTEW